jgi:drug/metabolite transporter (DMT)-like permease
MFKTLGILMVALVLESAGLALLSRGLRQIGEPASYAPMELLRLAGRGVTNSNILSGVALEAVFFGLFLLLMSQKDVTVVLPLTSLGFLLTTLIAKYFLHEEVSVVRWLGIGLIVCGSGLVNWSDQKKKASSPPPAPQVATATGQR